MKDKSGVISNIVAPLGLILLLIMALYVLAFHHQPNTEFFNLPPEPPLELPVDTGFEIASPEIKVLSDWTPIQNTAFKADGKCRYISVDGKLALETLDITGADYLTTISFVPGYPKWVTSSLPQKK